MILLLTPRPRNSPGYNVFASYCSTESSPFLGVCLNLFHLAHHFRVRWPNPIVGPPIITSFDALKSNAKLAQNSSNNRSDSVIGVSHSVMSRR